MVFINMIEDGYSHVIYGEHIALFYLCEIGKMEHVNMDESESLQVENCRRVKTKKKANG